MSESVKSACANYGKMPSFEKRGVACAVCSAVVFANCALATMKDVFGEKGIEMKKEMVRREAC